MNEDWTKPFSFAYTESEVEARRARAARLRGLKLARVEYLWLRQDPTHFEVLFEKVKAIGAKAVQDAGLGLKLAFEEGATVSVLYDMPSDREGIGIAFADLVQHLGDELSPMDMSGTNFWAPPQIGARITDVSLRYEDWSGPGTFWCPRIDLKFENSIEVSAILGRALPDGKVDESATDVAVIFSEC